MHCQCYTCSKVNAFLYTCHFFRVKCIPFSSSYYLDFSGPSDNFRTFAKIAKDGPRVSKETDCGSHELRYSREYFLKTESNLHPVSARSS